MTNSDEEDSDGEIQKIVINRCFGGFGLSNAALDRLVEEHGYETTGYDDEGEHENPDADIIDGDGHVTHHYSLLNSREPTTRTRPELVTVVQEMGEKADGPHASLDVVEVPARLDWVITEYDGVETVREKHRMWPEGGDAEKMMSSENIDTDD
jgi:hypothetical protein